jgi:hypothetical protein
MTASSSAKLQGYQCDCRTTLPGAPGAVDAAGHAHDQHRPEIENSRLVNHRFMDETRPVLRAVMGGGISTSQSVR